MIIIFASLMLMLVCEQIKLSPINENLNNCFELKRSKHISFGEKTNFVHPLFTTLMETRCSWFSIPPCLWSSCTHFWARWNVSCIWRKELMIASKELKWFETTKNQENSRIMSSTVGKNLRYWYFTRKKLLKYCCWCRFNTHEKGKKTHFNHHHRHLIPAKLGSAGTTKIEGWNRKAKNTLIVFSSMTCKCISNENLSLTSIKIKNTEL